MTEKDMLTAVQKLYNAIKMERAYLTNDTGRAEISEKFEKLVDEVYEDIKTNSGIEACFNDLKRGRIKNHILHAVATVATTTKMPLSVAAIHCINNVY